MIGVLADSANLTTAAELFQLFKTGWEPYVPGRRYDAVLTTHGRVVDGAKLVIACGAGPGEADSTLGVATDDAINVEVLCDGWVLPIFGPASVFRGLHGNLYTSSGGTIGFHYVAGETHVERVGYDIFAEVRHLLGSGQPAGYAQVPTLELHVELLRRWLVEARVPFAEVLARPADADFICCLTHDVDFVGLRRHRFNRTLLGFVARASVGTLLDVIRRRRPVEDLVRNIGALCSLPLVWCGLVRDPWRPFEAYARYEHLSHSTFFLVPFSGRPGDGPGGTPEPGRAVRYDLADVADEARAGVALGAELGVHGLDAWRDAAAGTAERRRISTLTPAVCGIRMHWLYFSDESPKLLEEAGFTYDSTCGYNEAIGFRAGTSQVFKWPVARHLLELPLAIMDSALLSRDRLSLSFDEALVECRRVIATVRRFGGTLVLNWHCRSVAPERLWGRLYRTLLDDIGASGRAWMASAGQAVDWFQWRRTITFSETADENGVRLCVRTPRAAGNPAAMNVYRIAAGEYLLQQIAFDGTDTVMTLCDARVTASARPDSRQPIGASPSAGCGQV